MRAAVTFAGIGSAALALQRAGFELAWFSEIDPKPSAVLAERFPGVPNLGDIKEIGRDAPAFDIITAGFPCQDISRYGPRTGLAGERSGLFHEVMRLVWTRRPRWVVLENVPGLLSSNGGRDLGTILGSLGLCGYGFAYRVLDAQFFGVPHRRRRIFVVATTGGAAAAAAVLHEPGGGGWHSAAGGESPAADAAHLGVGPGADSRPVPAFGEVARCLTAHAGRYDADTESFVVQAGRARLLTPLEKERIQGLPDGWTDVGIATGARSRGLGNSVALPVFEWIARRIAAAERVVA